MSTDRSPSTLLIPLIPAFCARRKTTYQRRQTVQYHHETDRKHSSVKLIKLNIDLLIGSRRVASCARNHPFWIPLDRWRLSKQNWMEHASHFDRYMQIQLKEFPTLPLLNIDKPLNIDHAQSNAITAVSPGVVWFIYIHMQSYGRLKHIATSHKK